MSCCLANFFFSCLAPTDFWLPAFSLLSNIVSLGKTLNSGLSLHLSPSWNINGTSELSRKHEGGRQEERHPIQGRVTILLVLSHYENQGKYRHPIGQLAHVLGILDKKPKLRGGGGVRVNL